MKANVSSKATKKGRDEPKRPGLLSDLPAESLKNGLINVVIETPLGSGNKLDYSPELGALQLKKVLPQGLVFPFDFGFIPSTLADDGDPAEGHESDIPSNRARG